MQTTARYNHITITKNDNNTVTKSMSIEIDIPKKCKFQGIKIGDDNKVLKDLDGVEVKCVYKNMTNYTYCLDGKFNNMTISVPNSNDIIDAEKITVQIISPIKIWFGYIHYLKKDFLVKLV